MPAARAVPQAYISVHVELQQLRTHTFAGRRCRLQRAVGSANLCWCLSSLLADVRICQCIVHPGNALRQKGEGLPGCELYSPVIWGCLPALLRDLRSDADLRR